MARSDRVAQAIKKEVSLILHEELKDPRLGFVTVTRVDLTSDLRLAKIFFSVLGKDEDYRRTKKALASALGFIRKLVAERINLRFAPEIIFKEDRSAEYSIRIQELLDEVNPVRDKTPEADVRLRRTVSNGVKQKNEPKTSRRVRKKK